MNHLNNNMTKMILLVLVAAVLLVALNLNHKKLGKEVALLGTLAVVLVAVVSVAAAATSWPVLLLIVASFVRLARRAG